MGTNDDRDRVHERNANTTNNRDSQTQEKKTSEAKVDEWGLSKNKVPNKTSPNPVEHGSALDEELDTDTFHDTEDGGAEEGSPPQSLTNADAKDTQPNINGTLKKENLNLSSSQGIRQDHRSVFSTEAEHRVISMEPPAAPEHSPSTVNGLPTSNETTAPVYIPNKEASPNHISARPSTPPANIDVRDGENSAKKPTRTSSGGPAISEWSHQRLAPQEQEVDQGNDEGDWQAMPALAEYDLYDDDGRQVAKAAIPENEEETTYSGLGGAGKGYTKVQLDEDAQSATSMDDNTRYLFKQDKLEGDDDDDEEQRDHLSQLQATKDLLTEGQRIAYVGVTRLAIYNMTLELEEAKPTKSTKRHFTNALESMKKWGQQMMVRLYAHMDIDSAEQLMIEQLAEHGVQPADLVPPLMNSARVKNPLAENNDENGVDKEKHSLSIYEKEFASSPSQNTEEDQRSPALQDATNGQEVPEVHTPSQMEHTANIDLDLRWTVLCDLFLTLIADSLYDSRSRHLLERVAAAMEISWVQICRFEKRVIDALEMQEEASKESWDEEANVEKHRKMNLKHKYYVMGLATVGGGLVIGLSAGLLAPVIGAGLAAGFTTIGVTGTAGFLGGVGGAALITSAGIATGGTIAVRASHRRTGAVKTFEYRPLHNNKRLNLIVTISGWMNGKVDDVRLPYSTVDPIMGDIYSLYWEPEMLQSMGDTINILATEALTQTVQQVLGSTILVALMASLQLPIVLTKLSYLIDNPWSVSLDRANSAGLILADSLISRHLGNRPITLVGFSLGSRLIFSCLKELAARGAHGLIQNVYLFGSPIVAKKDEYLRARTIVSGRFVNGYASNDWILGYLFRATSGGIMRVAGLAPVEEVPGLENVDVTKIVNGHMAYRATMPRLLREAGWEVESDEFTEIEDPDPENHAKRQRELIREIEEGRKEAEDKAGKRIFGLFKRGKPAQKKGWETYDEDNLERRSSSDGKKSFDGDGFGNGNILFDVEAIKRELESEMIEVKQLESTLPPMKVNLNGKGESDDSSSRPTLRQTQSEGLKGSQSELPSENGSSVKLALPLPPSEVDDSYSGMPRELSTTLPPLRLSSTSSRKPKSPSRSRSSSPSSSIANSNPRLPPRPDLKTSATMPTSFLPRHEPPNAAAAASLTTPLPPEPDTTSRPPAAADLDFSGVGSPGIVRSPVIEHNAWANGDDADDGDPDEWGQEREVKMTF